METNPLQKLAALGQSIWLDYIKRDFIETGKLKQLIDNDGLKGITSNPSIFEKALAEGQVYDQAIQALINKKQDVNTIYEACSQQDIQEAADLLLEVYHNTSGKDGYVSLEVNPNLSHDTSGTIAEARRLWQALKRPNVMIKVPGTLQGLPAITQLISEGININVTLLFSVARYQAVANAYIAGLKLRLLKGEPVNHIASVASFFLSRIDALVDPMLEKISDAGGERSALAKTLQGQIAITSAKAAYQVYQQLFASDEFKKLADKGANVQRLLWASTSTKNPSYSDIKYVEALIAPETVNTLPMETLEAYRDHGKPSLTLTSDMANTGEVFAKLQQLGIAIDKLTQQLEEEAVSKFVKSFEQLTATLKKKLTL